MAHREPDHEQHENTPDESTEAGILDPVAASEPAEPDEQSESWVTRLVTGPGAVSGGPAGPAQQTGGTPGP